MRRAHGSLAALAALLAAGSAAAAEGRRPIHAPTAITEPGSYVLTRSIGDMSTPSTIVVRADHVDIDLNGFTVYALEPAISAAQVTDLVIHDGMLVTSEDAIALTAVDQFAIRNVTVTSLEDCAVSVTGARGTIVDTTIRGAFNALCTDATSATIRGNRIAGNLLLTCRGCTIAGNQVENGRMEVRGAGSLVLENTVSGSWEDGIEVWGARNHVEGNVLTGNGGYGLHFEAGSSGNVYRRNTSRGNAGSAPPCPAANLDFCNEGGGNSSAGDNFMPSLF